MVGTKTANLSLCGTSSSKPRGRFSISRLFCFPRLKNEEELASYLKNRKG